VSVAPFRRSELYVAMAILVAIILSVRSGAQPPKSSNGAIIQGHVRDSNGTLVLNSTVSLQPAVAIPTDEIPSQTTRTDSDGAYRFASLRGGKYGLRAENNGYSSAATVTVMLDAGETRTIELVIGPVKSTEPQTTVQGTPAVTKPQVQTPEFFDEPQFTVAGITQATNAGGHGSDTVLRTTESLARATVLLDKGKNNEKDKDKDNGNDSRAGSNSPASAALENDLRDAVSRNPTNAELHHRLGNVEEKLGSPMEAVRQYERAAGLDPSEENLFDWGTELLAHRALEPATEVLAKGNRLFPQSVRTLVALGVAWYARGSYDQAAQCLINASDLDPENPTPYLFLGKMQNTETPFSNGSVERLERFVRLQPDNAMANYYYAIALWKQSAAPGPGKDELSAHEELLLQKAVRIDPKLSAAYLQLGILYSQRGDYAAAISEYRKAIEVSTQNNPLEDGTVEEAHYRLGQAYQRTGDKAKAQEELRLHDQQTAKTKEDAERERREIQEFVVTLRDKAQPVPPPQP
jgi:tetratricopeptide (TPR) repeat protein